MTIPAVGAVLFDKDGTLFDFGATWNVWAAQTLRDLSAGDEAVLQALARAARFDLAGVGLSARQPDHRGHEPRGGGMSRAGLARFAGSKTSNGT